VDPEDYRAASRDRWERAAAGWGAQREAMRAASEPVAAWLIDAVGVKPGETVLELAAGPGDTGLALAQRLRPGGRLIATDASDPMIELVRERAAELGLEEVVEARAMDAERIDLRAASVDGVLCRWGFMLFTDPDAALRETRRVLRPGRRVALAAWDDISRNPWASVVDAELLERGLIERPPPGAPGPFAWSDAAGIRERLYAAGFFDVQLATVEFTFAYPDLDTWWDSRLDLSVQVYDVVAGLSPADRDELREALDARMAPYVRSDGSVELPAATHVAAAGA
jgi:SAM-dependent methyltransferase